MTTIDLTTDEIELEVRRTEDELGEIQLRIATTERERISITVGRFYDDAASLADELERTAKEARQIVNEWRDLPDEHDAYVSEDRGRYVVQLEGLHWNGSKLVSVNRFPSREWRSFPTQDIATYELARAMSDAGCFPNAWYQNERGNTDDIGEEVRKYHDAGGDKMLPLAGIEYADDADIVVHFRIQTAPFTWEDSGAHSAQVIRDYGTLGIVYVLSGDDEERFTDDRSTITPNTDDDTEDDDA